MCPALTAPQSCDGPEDCQSGQSCCVSFPAGSSCAMACDGFGQVALCHLDSECPGEQVCRMCTYPGDTMVRICTNEGELAAGATSCD